MAALAAVMLLAEAGLSHAEPIYVSETKARIRSGPGTDYKVLWEAPRNTPLEYLAKYKDWYVVRDFQKDVGWVQEDSVSKGKGAIVTAMKATVHKSPASGAPVAYTAQRYYLFHVLQDKGEWLKVKDSEGEEGWILSKMVWISR